MIKFTFILLILVLLTIGATVIINPELRDELLKILQSFNLHFHLNYGRFLELRASPV